MMRAYSLLETKSIDAERREFSGVATSPQVDRVGDVIEPLGCTYSNPTVLLWQHQHDCPIGSVHFDPPTKSGVTFRARIPKIDEPGPLQDSTSTAWNAVKAGIVRAVSVGFRPLDGQVTRNAAGGLHFLAVELLELSLVSVPANSQATITAIKKYAAQSGLDLKSEAQARRDLATKLGDAEDPDRPSFEQVERVTARHRRFRQLAERELAEAKKSGDKVRIQIAEVALSSVTRLQQESEMFRMQNVFHGELSWSEFLSGRNFSEPFKARLTNPPPPPSAK